MRFRRGTISPIVHIWICTRRSIADGLNAPSPWCKPWRRGVLRPACFPQSSVFTQIKTSGLDLLRRLPRPSTRQNLDRRASLAFGRDPSSKGSPPTGHEPQLNSDAAFGHVGRARLEKHNRVMCVVFPFSGFVHGLAASGAPVGSSPWTACITGSFQLLNWGHVVYGP